MSICPTCKTTYPDTMRLCPTDGSVLEGGGAPEDDNVGRSLDGKYRLDKRLNSGGMGTVYKATHLMLGKTMAVKLIKANLPASPEVVRRFQREAKAASALNHPNIAPAYDLGQTQDGTLYIAMEYIDGASLKDVIQAGPIAPERTIHLLRQVASALSLAHRHEIIHRDLKPQNIMVTKDADGHEVAKLLDFGIAKTLDDSATQLTATGFSLGTPQYMSPEQAYGRPVDGRSDIYSLGIILYEMLAGEVPFSDPSTPAVLVKQMTEMPIPPSLKRPDRSIPPELAAIALKCLEKDPANRFQTADEFGAALDAAAVSSGTILLPLPGHVPAAGTDSRAAAPTVVIGATPGGQTTRLPTPGPIPTPSGQTTQVIGGAATPGPAAAPAPPIIAATPAASTSVRPVTPAASPAAAPAVAPAVAQAPSAQGAPAKSGSGGRAAFVVIAALILLGGLAYGAVHMGLIGQKAQPATQLAATAPPAAAPAADSSASGAGGAGAPASPASPPAAPPASASTPAPQSPAVVTPPPSSPPKPARSAPDHGTPANGPSASQSGTAQPSASPAAPPQAAPALPPPPANPSVAFRCDGPTDVCGALKSAMDQTLAKDSMVSVRDVPRADVAVQATVTLVDQQTQTMFGTTFTIRNYSIDVNGQAPRTGNNVAMPSAATLNYDARYRDRLDEKARVVASSVVESIRDYWKKR